MGAKDAVENGRDSGRWRVATRAGAALAMLAALAPAACGTASQTVRMDPMEFTATRTADGVQVDLLDPEVLFTEGVRAFEDRRNEDAARKFDLVLKHFASSRFAKPALFDRGLALLAIPRPADAARDFEAYLAAWPGDPDTADATLRLGQALSDAGEWDKAEDALKRRAGMQPLTLTQEVEIRARRTLALRMLGRYEEARDEAGRVAALHDRFLTLPEMDGNYFVAMASFQAAEVYHDLFGRIKFVLPVERMEKDLLDKATLFMKAQAEYLRTVRLRNTFWGVSAGVRVGRLYEEFYDDMMAAEVPADLTTDDLKIYMDELKRKARPLVAKAVDAYERNMALARTYGARDEWFGDMGPRLERLRKVLSEIPPDKP
jgi:tetratricopeptide (TPR) repeat protein